jgi:hypothetical protein
MFGGYDLVIYECRQCREEVVGPMKKGRLHLINWRPLSFRASARCRMARLRHADGHQECPFNGDRMLVAISMVDAAPARGDVHARMQVSPGECNGHFGGHPEFINARLVN